MNENGQARRHFLGQNPASRLLPRSGMRANASAIVMFVAGLSIVAAAQRSTPPLPPIPADPVAASVDDISNHPDRFFGKAVTVVEDVARVMGARVFTLDEESPLGRGKDVMVVAPAGVTVREDDDVEVTGVVQQFSWTQLEKEKFDFDFSREWQLEFKSRPVIYATSVRPAKSR